MPACSNLQAFGGPGDTMVRCAELQIASSMGTHTVFLGGMAEATFPGIEERPLSSLQPGEFFTVQWRAAFFSGHHPVLGPVHATLRPQNAAPNPGFGEVASLAPQSGNTGSQPGDEFFPALNKNTFMFRVTLPRLSLVLDSASPVVNQATIQNIPPVGAEYQMVQPVEFAANRARSASLTGLAGGTFKLETCRVKIMELKGISASLSLVSESDDKATFALRLVNESTEDNVDVTWLIWPRPEEPTRGSEGAASLTRKPKTVRFTVARDIFFKQRFIAIAISRPFETDGAFVTAFPALA